jgi:amino acid transporter
MFPSLGMPFHDLVRLAFHIFVVVVGTLILSGAVNTAIVGSNGVLNRVSEDGVLSDWFCQPHPTFGTSYRIINMVVALQILMIIISRGDVTLLANLYAFGVIWSFVLNGIAMHILRYKQPEGREFRVPPNLRIFGRELPVGVTLVNLIQRKSCIITMSSISRLISCSARRKESTATRCSGNYANTFMKFGRAASLRREVAAAQLLHVQIASDP